MLTLSDFAGDVLGQSLQIPEIESLRKRGNIVSDRGILFKAGFCLLIQILQQHIKPAGLKGEINGSFRGSSEVTATRYTKQLAYLALECVFGQDFVLRK